MGAIFPLVRESLYCCESQKQKVIMRTSQDFQLMLFMFSLLLADIVLLKGGCPRMRFSLHIP